MRKVSPSETRYYFYDLNDRPVWEYKVGVGWETFNYYFQGRLAVTNTVASATPLQWIYSDHLGSPSVKVSATGTVLARDWYFPYGHGQMPSGDAIKYRYTGKERDAESGLHLSFVIIPSALKTLTLKLPAGRLLNHD